MRRIKSDKLLKLAKALITGKGTQCNPNIDFEHYMKRDTQTISSTFYKRLAEGKKT